MYLPIPRYPLSFFFSAAPVATRKSLLEAAH